VGEKVLIRTGNRTTNESLDVQPTKLVTILIALRLSNHGEMRESNAVPGEVRKLYKQRRVIVNMPPLPPHANKVVPIAGLVTRKRREKPIIQSPRKT